MTRENGYWSGTLARRLNRRRALAIGAGAGALGALSLAGCGGGDGGDDSGGGESGLLAKVEDTSGKAVPGGIFQSFEASDIQGMDPYGGTSARAQFVSYFCYPRMIKNKTSFSGTHTEDKEGDLAESWEFSDDGLTLTFKLRQVIWDRRAPTNGRPVDAEDVLFSADRFLRLSPNANNFFNSKSEAAPIVSLAAPDSRTVVMKLKFPYVPLLATLSRALNIQILPRESDGKFDPKNEVRGAGPWALSNYQSSSIIEFRRNPDWYLKGRPFLEGWSAPIVPEYATQLAQFRAGNIWGGVVRQEDVLAVKQDIPALNMFKGDYGTGTPAIFFGFQGPFKDARIRQALSMSIDRQLHAETLSDSAKFQAAGLPSTIRLNNFIGAGWEGYWLEPAGKDMGDAAKYFKLDLAEARKLLNAAGITGKLSTKLSYPHNGYGAVYQQYVQLLQGIIQESGLFDAKLNPLDYQTDYIPNVHFGGNAIGAWDGIAVTPAAQGDDPGHQLLAQYHSGGNASRQPKGEDPKLDQMIEAQIRETDVGKRTALIKDIQRYMVTTMIAIPFHYQAAGFTLNWPWVGNAGAVRGGNVVPTESYPYFWFDKATYDKVKSA